MNVFTFEELQRVADVLNADLVTMKSRFQPSLRRLDFENGQVAVIQTLGAGTRTLGTYRYIGDGDWQGEIVWPMTDAEKDDVFYDMLEMRLAEIPWHVIARKVRGNFGRGISNCRQMFSNGLHRHRMKGMERMLGINVCDSRLRP